MSDRPTPETKEAWDAVSRLPSGMYDSRVSIRAYATAMSDHSRKMERQRDELLEALEACRYDSCELLGERNWWKDEHRCDYRKRYEETAANIVRADAAIAAVKGATT